MEEIWKPVLGFEGHYEVSNLGRVRSLDRIATGPSGRQRRRRGQMLRDVIDRHGYSLVGVNNELGKHLVRVHRLVAEAFCDHPEAAKSSITKTATSRTTSRKTLNGRQFRGIPSTRLIPGYSSAARARAITWVDLPRTVFGKSSSGYPLVICTPISPRTSVSHSRSSVASRTVSGGATFAFLKPASRRTGLSRPGMESGYSLGTSCFRHHR